MLLTAFWPIMENFPGFELILRLWEKKDEKLEEACGYYGEKVVLYAQTLGLNTCWVDLTYSKGKARVQIDKGEKLCLVIAVGYGTTLIRRKSG